MSKPVIAVTMGDPGGIGPEIIAKAFCGMPMSRRFFWVLLGDPRPFDCLRERFGVEFRVRAVNDLTETSLSHSAVNFYDVRREALIFMERRRVAPRRGALKKILWPGVPDLENAAWAFAAIGKAASLAGQGKVRGVVTAPVCKEAMRMISPDFVGHTEYLAACSGREQVAMMFAGGKMRVTLVTIHMPLKNVSRSLTRRKIEEKTLLTCHFLKYREHILRPRLAVAALNPHGSETGEEEERVILPAIRNLKKAGVDVKGPVPADRIFYEAFRGRYDAVISLYHDQGLGPFKMVHFNDGVNVTLGLPYVRTSPDHGTAFDIAYRNRADPSSMKMALLKAKKWVLADS